MSDETAFLRAILAAPEDHTHRLVYADWLEERGDPRADVLRLNWDVPHIHFLDWAERVGTLSYYLQRDPDLYDQLEKRRSPKKLREHLKALKEVANPGWLAFMETLGHPFHPFFFWNNSTPQTYQPDQLPFSEQIGTRGAVITFQSAFRDESSWDTGLLRDMQFLCQLELKECCYGGATCPVHPFVCELITEQRPLTGTDVIEALKVRDFRSDPGHDGNEIHNDVMRQIIFPWPDDEIEEFGEDETGVLALMTNAHRVLKKHLETRQLWYVRLNSTPDEQRCTERDSGYVVLFAVGRSPTGNRLLGVVSHQVGH